MDLQPAPAIDLDRQGRSLTPDLARPAFLAATWVREEIEDRHIRDRLEEVDAVELPIDGRTGRAREVRAPGIIASRR